MRRVVVTGMGCISPVGNDVSSFWDSLINGRHGFARISRFDTSDFKVTLAAEVKAFDPCLYMDRSDIKKTDLYAQYAIGAATQAVCDSGICGTLPPDRLGVYIGSGIGGMTTFVAETEKLLTRGASRISPFFIPMMIGNMASALVAIKYNAQGVNLPVVTACATSTHAIGEAFHAIKHGYADAIIAGGAEAAITPLAVGGFTSCMALTQSTDPDCCSIPFDMRRSGFVMGEGAGMLVLEEYSHAASRGAKIYCELSGYGNTCDAYHMTAPLPEGAVSSRVITLAFDEAGIKPDERLYINPHGTSTTLNDKSETRAIKNALSDLAYRVPLSSTKSMTGHMLGAAGAIEAIASIMVLETGIVPPTAGYCERDPDCDLDYVTEGARKCNIDKALSLSLGFGGHNAGLLFTKCEVQ